jgi:hypothetical protein
LVALGDIKNDLLAVMTDIEKEVSLLNDDQRTIKLSLEKFDTKGLLLQVFHESLSFLNP